MKSFKCNKCGKCFTNKSAVKSHIIIFHINFNNKFSNNSNDFDNNYNRRISLNNFLINRKLMCDWPECRFRTKYNFEMKIHKISAHHNSLQKLNQNSQKQQNKAITEDNEDVEQQVQQFDYKSNECEQQFLNSN